jgi:ADP-ribose pyrophosphatase YjhB (NUDIX family)
MSQTPPQPPFSRTVPAGDNRERDVCGACGFVHYVNPKIVVGAVVTVPDGRILMCKRAIEPGLGFWTLPAGFLEEQETAEEGAIREAQEEANAAILIDGLLGVYSVPRISQIQLMFRARLAGDAFSPGVESLEVALFAWDAIPWEHLAFPSVKWALGDYRAFLAGAPAPFTNPEGTIYR